MKSIPRSRQKTPQTISYWAARPFKAIQRGTPHPHLRKHEKITSQCLHYYENTSFPGYHQVSSKSDTLLIS